MNHWSSSEAFGLGSDLLQNVNVKSCDIRRRKTFLSLVSVSSKSDLRQN